jgi:protocatechuate 3,4-dioxygenase beta subunit
VKRAPTKPLVVPPQTLSEVTGPLFGHTDISPNEADLTAQHPSDPIGERMFVSGRVLDENGRPVPDALIEIWQANAAGRYRHTTDNHDAPLDPNFTGCGRLLTDAHGRYQFRTIKPGAYPWGNHFNAWRPAHVHLSIFGRGFMQRLVTQFYFPGDPLLAYDPMFMSVPDERARQRLVAELDWEHVVPGYALAYRFDIVLRGRDATPMER